MTTSETSSRETSPFVQPLKTLIQIFTDEENKPANEATPSLSMAETLNLLSHTRRRAAIEQLSNSKENSISVTELAEQIACAENGCSPSELKDDERQQVCIALLHSHLPRLENADIVIYNTEKMTVTAGPLFEHLWDAYMTLSDTVS